MNILEQKENKLLNREEIIVELTSETIPSKTEVTKQISEKLKKPEENIIINQINTQFGNHTFKVSAKVYEDSESKDKYETLSKKERKKIAEEKKKAAEEKKKQEEEAKKEAETPKEEPKEEIKEEATPEKEPTETPKEENAKPDEAPKEETKTEEKEE
tara:strand:+ start:1874 stop:2347 length:474 start_codon:yes stop_codon:yes gene_type:complete